MQEVMTYKIDPEPLKRFPPWISRTQSGIDINLILNANRPSDNNILLTNGVLKPGFLYAGLAVENVQASTEALKKAGVSVYSDDEMSALGLAKDKIPACDGPSVFIADPDMNLFRLVQAK